MNATTQRRSRYWPDAKAERRTLGADVHWHIARCPYCAMPHAFDDAKGETPVAPCGPFRRVRLVKRESGHTETLPEVHSLIVGHPSASNSRGIR